MGGKTFNKQHKADKPKLDKKYKKKLKNQRKVAWEPQAKQTEALESSAFEILYGGARGGGKTDAGIAWLLYDIQNPFYRFLVIRRNADDLRDWVDRARQIYTNPQIGAEFTGNPVEIRFPSGAIGRTGHLKDENAYEKYQGHEYQKILIEELTHIPSEVSYLKLISSCRSTVDEIRPQVFATTNPGSAGHEWVKDRWDIPDAPMKKVEKIDSVSERRRVFIPAKVEDNDYLMLKDPEYVKFLESLPEGLRQQWRDGSWADYQIEGAYYATHLRGIAEQIKDIPYEANIPVTTAWDLGIGDATSIWFIQNFGKEIRFIDYYENSGEALNHYIKYCQDKPYVYDRHIAPHDIEVRELSTGKTRRDIARNLGIDFSVAPNIPVDDGINAVRVLFNRFWFDKEKCSQGIRAIKNYRKIFDEKRQVYKIRPLHDWSSHAADALRMYCVAHQDQASMPTFRITYNEVGKPQIL